MNHHNLSDDDPGGCTVHHNITNPRNYQKNGNIVDRTMTSNTSHTHDTNNTNLNPDPTPLNTNPNGHNQHENNALLHHVIAQHVHLLTPTHLDTCNLLLQSGQSRLFDNWDDVGINDESKVVFLDEIARVNGKCDLKEYAKRAKRLISNFFYQKNTFNDFVCYPPIEPYYARVSMADNAKWVQNYEQSLDTDSAAQQQQQQQPLSLSTQTPFTPLKSDSNLFLLEKIGLEHIAELAFVLVAGGMGERLGYPRTKISIPFNSITATTMIEFYCEFISALQYRAEQMMRTAEAPGQGHHTNREIPNPASTNLSDPISTPNPTNPTSLPTQLDSKSSNRVVLPLFIMTSDDTHEQTIDLLQKGNYFSLQKEQIMVLKQQQVPSLIDSAANFKLIKTPVGVNQDDGNKTTQAQNDGQPPEANNTTQPPTTTTPTHTYSLETKPHGHGDIHYLLYHDPESPLNNGLFKKMKVKYLFFFQDTNPLAFNVLASLLGRLIHTKSAMCTMALDRYAGDAVGGLVTLVRKTKIREILADPNRDDVQHRDQRGEKNNNNTKRHKNSTKGEKTDNHLPQLPNPNPPTSPQSKSLDPTARPDLFTMNVEYTIFSHLVQNEDSYSTEQLFVPGITSDPYNPLVTVLSPHPSTTVGYNSPQSQENMSCAQHYHDNMSFQRYNSSNPDSVLHDSDSNEENSREIGVNLNDGERDSHEQKREKNESLNGTTQQQQQQQQQTTISKSSLLLPSQSKFDSPNVLIPNNHNNTTSTTPSLCPLNRHEQYQHVNDRYEMTLQGHNNNIKILPKNETLGNNTTTNNNTHPPHSDSPHDPIPTIPLNPSPFGLNASITSNFALNQSSLIKNLSLRSTNALDSSFLVQCPSLRPTKTHVGLYPGNSNVFVVELESYIHALEQSSGVIGEFINPKIDLKSIVVEKHEKDQNQSAESDTSHGSNDQQCPYFKFTTSGRLECLMQDIPLSLPRPPCPIDVYREPIEDCIDCNDDIDEGNNCLEDNDDDDGAVIHTTTTTTTNNAQALSSNQTTTKPQPPLFPITIDPSTLVDSTHSILHYPTWFGFSPIKNSLKTAKDKILSQNNGESVITCEFASLTFVKRLLLLLNRITILAPYSLMYRFNHNYDPRLAPHHKNQNTTNTNNLAHHSPTSSPVSSLSSLSQCQPTTITTETPSSPIVEPTMLLAEHNVEQGPYIILKPSAMISPMVDIVNMFDNTNNNNDNNQNRSLSLESFVSSTDNNKNNNTNPATPTPPPPNNGLHLTSNSILIIDSHHIKIKSLHWDGTVWFVTIGSREVVIDLSEKKEEDVDDKNTNNNTTNPQPPSVWTPFNRGIEFIDTIDCPFCDGNGNPRVAGRGYYNTNDNNNTTKNNHTNDTTTPQCRCGELATTIRTYTTTQPRGLNQIVRNIVGTITALPRVTSSSVSSSLSSTLPLSVSSSTPCDVFLHTYKYSPQSTNLLDICCDLIVVDTRNLDNGNYYDEASAQPFVLNQSNLDRFRFSIPFELAE